MINENTIQCVILNYNDYETTKRLVKKIENYKIIKNIIIVDNKSTDDSLLKLQKLENKKIDVIAAEINGGYGYGNNLGVFHSLSKYNSKYTLIANPDVLFEEQMVEKMTEYIIKEKAAVVATRQLNSSDALLVKNGWDIPSSFEYILKSFFSLRKLYKRKDKKYFNDKYVQYPECVPGSLLLVDTHKFCIVGGYDEKMFLYSEETLLGIKLKEKGFITVLLNEKYYHYHSQTISKFMSRKKQAKQINKSRRYLVKNYIKPTKYLSWLYDLLFFIALIENYIILLILSIFRKER